MSGSLHSRHIFSGITMTTGYIYRATGVPMNTRGPWHAVFACWKGGLVFVRGAIVGWGE
ncbi:MAG TPA: hypothetical protein VME86_16750 [Acidobacteriaceae bacterium]|nr:hypothetical protein [Acidobacteriaceae bacterium]